MNILDTLRERVTAAGTALMLAPPLTAAQARDLLAVVDALADDKRSLARIVDELSAQVNALNQTLQGVVMAQNAELLDQLGDALAYINAGCVEVVDGRTVTVGNGIEVQGE